MVKQDMSCIVYVFTCVYYDRRGFFFEDGLVLSCSAFLVVHAVSRARPAFCGLVVHMVQPSHRPAHDYKKTSSL